MNKIIRPEDRGWDRVLVDEIVRRLSEQGAKISYDSYFQNVGAFDYVLTFCPTDQVRVTIALEIADWQTDSDVVITDMTTLPEAERGKGYGSRIIRLVVDWASRNQFNEIRAVQVSNPRSQNFWENNGFVYLPEPNPTGDCIYYLNR